MLLLRRSFGCRFMLGQSCDIIGCSWPFNCSGQIGNYVPPESQSSLLELFEALDWVVLPPPPLLSTAFECVRIGIAASDPVPRSHTAAKLYPTRSSSVLIRMHFSHHREVLVVMVTPWKRSGCRDRDFLAYHSSTVTKRAVPESHLVANRAVCG